MPAHIYILTYLAAPCPTAFLICPRTPETVRILAPSNLATSRSELNIPWTKAVFLKTLAGVPTSLSFFCTAREASSSRTTPVNATRKPGLALERDWTARRPCGWWWWWIGVGGYERACLFL